MSKLKTVDVDHKEVKSISEEQLKGLQEAVNKQNQIQMQIGGIEGHKATLVIQLQGVAEGLQKMQADLEKEYGAVNIDLKTGEISETDVPASN
jgi:hypothetical protein|tara:strand:- start:28 stop:306 length:279 start_codon:yes stop_codon:yes gene_type:complete